MFKHDAEKKGFSLDHLPDANQMFEDEVPQALMWPVTLAKPLLWNFKG